MVRASLPSRPPSPRLGNLAELPLPTPGWDTQACAKTCSLVACRGVCIPEHSRLALRGTSSAPLPPPPPNDPMHNSHPTCAIAASLTFPGAGGQATPTPTRAAAKAPTWLHSDWPDSQLCFSSKLHPLQAVRGGAYTSGLRAQAPQAQRRWGSHSWIASARGNSDLACGWPALPRSEAMAKSTAPNRAYPCSSTWQQFPKGSVGLLVRKRHG